MATDGSDYIGGVYNVTFTKGSSEAELRIPILDDDLPEPGETFTVMLMIPDSAEGVEAGENNIATVTITDDDKKLVNFNPTEYSVSENGTYVILMLMLNAPAEENCTVKVMTIDGTAIGKSILYRIQCTYPDPILPMQLTCLHRVSSPPLATFKWSKLFIPPPSLLPLSSPSVLTLSLPS